MSDDELDGNEPDDTSWDDEGWNEAGPVAAFAAGIPMSMDRGPASVTCRFCGGELDVHQRVTNQTCSRPDCRVQLGKETVAKAGAAIEERAEARRRLAQRRMEPALEEVKRRLGPAGEGANTAIVPYTNAGLAPLPAERLAEFEAHLDRIIEEGFGPDYEGYNDDPDYRYGDRMRFEADDPFAATCCCIACRGNCCHLGRESKAFLTGHMVNYYRYRDPAATPEQIREDYLSRLPETSTVDGCVYQGPMGCTLPREMRADICNSFRCGGQDAMMEALSANPDAPAAIVALTLDHALTEDPDAPVLRALTMTAEGEITIHEDIPLPPMPPEEGDTGREGEVR